MEVGGASSAFMVESALYDVTVIYSVGSDKSEVR